ncbi:MAG: helix-turn-helix domain-containing protein [Bacteroidota bacterium]|nr:helix-turn-helix domain-containing protein [Bacteroidota bacterium]
MQQSDTEKIPYLRDLASFYKHVKARPPLHKEFDIREINPEVLKNYDFVAKPFRHSFYCMALFLEGDISLNTGFWKVRLKRPAVYFKTPCQVVSWQKPERWLKEYFIVFTDRFLADHKSLADIIFDLPFFQLEKAIPFEIDPDEVTLLKGIYEQILKEYRSDFKDKFALISSYVHTLLLQVQRLYYKNAETDEVLTTHIHQHEYHLVKSFQSLIRNKIAEGEFDNRHLTVKYFASLLSTHPNHLNAVVKRQRQKTAIAFMHEQILLEAQSLLNQTEFTIKNIAGRLGFADSSHFNHFFKKQTGDTPAAYRKVQKL